MKFIQIIKGCERKAPCGVIICHMVTFSSYLCPKILFSLYVDAVIGDRCFSVALAIFPRNILSLALWVKFSADDILKYFSYFS